MRYATCIGLMVLAVGVQAREATPRPLVHETMPLVLPVAGLPGAPGDDVLMFISSEIGGRGVVKGAPYSATAIGETRQTLQDGNRITRSTSTRLFRDGQGRTRQEQAKGVVFINDVVAGKRILLNPERKYARELPIVRPPLPPTPPVPPTPGVDPIRPAPPAPPAPPTPPPNMSSEEARTWSESMREWAREFSSRMRRDAHMVERDVNVVVRRGDGAEPVIKERVEVVRMDGGPGAMHPPGFPMMVPPGPGTTTSLGTRDFDGVRADGTRTTWTIPAGRIGNEKPIDIVSERWYSPELMLVVYSRHADPRTGERIYRLEGLKREEPPADLFRIPSDYETRTAASPRSEKK